MATQVQLRRGTATENNSFTGAQGELTFDTTNKRVRIHDGATAGGFELKTENSSGDTLFADNEKAIFGAGSDLQIYHDGSDSYIDDAGTGRLHLRGNDQVTLGKYTGENMVVAVADGQVELYYDSAVKLATTSTGIDVTGTVTADGLTVNSGTNNTVAKFESSDAGAFIILEDSGSTNDGNRIAVEGNVMSFATGDSERMRIDSNGRVAIGGTTVTDVNMLNIQGSGASSNIGIVFNDTNSSKVYGIQNGGSTLKFFDYTASAERMRISSAGDVELIQSNNLYWKHQGGGTIRAGITADSSDNLTFSTGSSDTTRMTLDGSGNLLVGRTSTSDTVAGGMIRPDGFVQSTRDGNIAADFNRNTSDGDIVRFSKGSSPVGSIGVGGSSAQPIIGSGNTGSGGTAAGLRFDRANNAIEPWNVITNASADNIIDLGFSSIRFDDIYATNGTIQTSDRNEKQDIAELSDAEQRVAVAAKGLMRKFRWKDAVAEKGNEARTHFGIIAQDLQAAFAAEGLDAGDYAMFISSTWTDEETGEERTRMGVRYSELLAFIIAAI